MHISKKMLQNRQKKPTDGNETIWRCFLRWRNLIFEVLLSVGPKKSAVAVVQVTYSL